ncbi:MAG: hypothetical protein J7L11_09225 [Thermoprotei archaeon]|nr:hypothetical protein [Thermoprotei archaeon]
MVKKAQLNAYTPEELILVFRRMKEEYGSGAMSLDEYTRWLEAFKFWDETGKYWTIGFRSEEWYYHDGKSWVRGMPPQTLFSAPEAQPLATASIPRASPPRSVMASTAHSVTPSSTKGALPAEMGRPLGIAILAVLNVIIGIAAIAASMLLLLAPEAIYSITPSLAAYAHEIGGSAMVLGALTIAIGRGLWRGSRWAWALSVIFCALSICFSAFSMSLSSGGYYTLGGLAFAILILAYFLRPVVRAWFRKTR